MTTFNFRGLPDCFVRMIRFFVLQFFHIYCHTFIFIFLIYYKCRCLQKKRRSVQDSLRISPPAMPPFSFCGFPIFFSYIFGHIFLFMFLNINIFTKISFIIFYISIHKRMCARLTQLFAPSASCNGGHFPDINHQILLCFSKEEMWKIWEGWLYSMEIFIPHPFHRNVMYELYWWGKV